MMPCPNERTLIRLVDQALSLDETERLTEHVSVCAVCRQQDNALRTLIADVRVDGEVELNVEAHVRSVVSRLYVRDTSDVDERVA